jgi:putative Ca2+/H+ antiporter (TMEM165/GDT1 family)
VGIGSFLALVGVAVLAALLGRAILRKVPLNLIHQIAGALFTVFAIVAAVAAIRG